MTDSAEVLSRKDAEEWGAQLESCGSCGADLGPSPSYPWHWPWEDCRACREPFEHVKEI